MPAAIPVSAILAAGQPRITDGEPVDLRGRGREDWLDRFRGRWRMRDGAHRRARWPRLVTAGLAALAVLAVPSAAQAGGPILTVTPHHLKFGRQPFGSFTS